VVLFFPPSQSTTTLHAGAAPPAAAPPTADPVVTVHDCQRPLLLYQFLPSSHCPGSAGLYCCTIPPCPLCPAGASPNRHSRGRLKSSPSITPSGRVRAWWPPLLMVSLPFLFSSRFCASERQHQHQHQHIVHTPSTGAFHPSSTPSVHPIRDRPATGRLLSALVLAASRSSCSRRYAHPSPRHHLDMQS